jgi:hypothetical protein
MARGATLQVHGYREFLRAVARAENDQRRRTRETFRDVGEDVRASATSHFSPVNARSAAGYRTRVRQTGIVVQQSLRKTTGQHPEWGALQMRTALIPALMSNEDETVRKLERALDRVAAGFERGP